MSDGPGDPDDPPDPSRGSLAAFERLLMEGPRTYTDLMALTGVSYRTAKVRLRELRRTHTIEEVWLPYAMGRGPVMMRIRRPKPVPVPPPPPVVIVPSNRAQLPLHVPHVVVAVELLLSDADIEDVDGLIEAIAFVIRWPPPELRDAITRVFGKHPSVLMAELLKQGPPAL